MLLFFLRGMMPWLGVTTACLTINGDTENGKRSGKYHPWWSIGWFYFFFSFLPLYRTGYFFFLTQSQVFVPSQDNRLLAIFISIIGVSVFSSKSLKESFFKSLFSKKCNLNTIYTVQYGVRRYVVIDTIHIFFNAPTMTRKKKLNSNKNRLFLSYYNRVDDVIRIKTNMQTCERQISSWQEIKHSQSSLYYLMLIRGVDFHSHPVIN